MNPLIQLKATSPLLITLALLCFGLLSKVEAVVPAPDGGYPGFNTAEGHQALFNLTTGSANTAVGWYSLFSNTEGNFNTATGAGALLFNTARENTAFGAAALLFNSTGVANTAVGAAALLNNTEGGFNTSIGEFALSHNTTGSNNTANGFQALFSNTSGDRNTATGWQALVNNTGANNNTAHGFEALHNSNSGNNTGIGFDALKRTQLATAILPLAPTRSGTPPVPTTSRWAKVLASPFSLGITISKLATVVLTPMTTPSVLASKEPRRKPLSLAFSVMALSVATYRLTRSPASSVLVLVSPPSGSRRILTPWTRPVK